MPKFIVGFSSGEDYSVILTAVPSPGGIKIFLSAAKKSGTFSSPSKSKPLTDFKVLLLVPVKCRDKRLPVDFCSKIGEKVSILEGGYLVINLCKLPQFYGKCSSVAAPEYVDFDVKYEYLLDTFLQSVYKITIEEGGSRCYAFSYTTSNVVNTIGKSEIQNIVGKYACLVYSAEDAITAELGGSSCPDSSIYPIKYMRIAESEGELESYCPQITGAGEEKIVGKISSISFVGGPIVYESFEDTGSGAVYVYTGSPSTNEITSGGEVIAMLCIPKQGGIYVEARSYSVYAPALNVYIPFISGRGERCGG